MRKQDKQQHEKIRALQASVAALQQEKAQVVKPYFTTGTVPNVRALVTRKIKIKNKK